MKKIPEGFAVILFTFTSLLAILVSQVFSSQEGVHSASSGTQSILYIILFTAMTVIFSAAVLFVARRKGMRIVKGLFMVLSLYVIFVVSLPLSIILVTAQVYVINSYSILEVYAIWFGIPVIMAYLLLFRREWYVMNTVGILLCVGLSSIWGITLNAWYTVLLLSIFAVYDYIAVYRTKHMIDLADVSIKGGMPMLFYIPERRGTSMHDVSIESGREGSGTMLLGFGDVALPSIMVVSSAIYGSYSLFPFIILPIVGAVAGMILLFIFARKPAPGLPYINAGAILGFLAAFLISVYL